MSNKGKYIDRNPDVPAAGKLLKSIENIGDSLKNYSVEEAAFNIVNLKCKQLHKDAQENNHLRYSQFLPQDGLKDLLSPELRKSRFIAFKEQFSEDMFFKKAEIGKADTLPSKPAEFTNENFTYGIKQTTTEKLYDLVFPNNKTAEEVAQDFIKWHDKLLFSPKPRNYNDHFTPHAVYGVTTNADKTGLKAKKCLQFCDRMVVINKAQKKFQDQKTGQLGKKIDRYNLNLSPNRTYGKRSMNQNSLNVKALLENVEPCAKNTEITEALTHVNNLRRHLFNRSDFHMNDLKTILKISDANGAGCVKFSIIMKLLRSLQIHVDEQKIRAAMLHFHVFKNDESDISEMVNTEEFWKMLHIQYPLPRKIDSAQLMNKICTKFPTTYRLLCSDRDKPSTAPQLTADEYDLTTAGDLITPDVSMRYGLSSKDFNVLRPKEEMCIIFKHLLMHNFDQVWQFACTKKAGGSPCEMSVNEFKNYLVEYNRQLQ